MFKLVTHFTPPHKKTKTETITLQLPIFVINNIIAPIKIGKKTVVGAGSTLTKNVKSKSLALTRAKKIEVKNYKRK